MKALIFLKKSHTKVNKNLIYRFFSRIGVRNKLPQPLAKRLIT